MSRFLISLSLALLLAISLGLKFQPGARARPTTQHSENADIVATLAKSGFVVKLSETDTDPPWVSGVRGQCRLQIANVSPQGWHRSVVEWKAGDDTVVYSAGAALYGSQPIVRTVFVHYIRALERYMGINAPPPRIRAIIISGNCPAGIAASTELAALSD